MRWLVLLVLPLLTLVLIVSSAVLLARQAAAPAAPPPTAAEIDSMLKPRVGSHPGLGIIVGTIDATGKRTIVHAGSAGEGVSRPLDADTVFEIGSISKVFTAALLADMVRRGEVSLEDPVAKLLPASVHVPSRDGREITLLSLATHSSGLPRMPTNFTPKDPENPYADYTVAQMYEFLSSYKLPRPVGETVEYSNLGVGLLGHALALRLGKSYEAAVAERILRPLGMKDTAVVLTPGMKSRMSVGHAGGGYATSNWDLPTLAGAGGIRSTVNDMLTFLAASLGSGPAAVRAALEMSQAPRLETKAPPGHVGLAWQIRDDEGVRIIWHNGGTGGFHSFAGLDGARRLAVVVLYNSSASIDDLGFHLLNPRLALAPVTPPSRPRTEVKVDPATLEHYAGQYAIGSAFVITITREGDRLFLQATGQPRFPVFAESETTFFLKVVDAQITFVKDEAGKIIALVLHQNGMDQRAIRR